MLADEKQKELMLIAMVARNRQLARIQAHVMDNQEMRGTLLGAGASAGSSATRAASAVAVPARPPDAPPKPPSSSSSELPKSTSVSSSSSDEYSTPAHSTDVP